MTTEFDFRALTAQERYKLMIGAIVPRPIALVTTVDAAGRVNAAPFSFFNCLSADPPILALGVENHPDLRFKDTAANIRDTEVFTVNIVSRAIAEAMHVTAVRFPPEVDELAEAGLTARPGVAVASPWIAEAPAAFECRRHVTLSLGRSREIILGEILHAHFAPEAVDDRLHVNPAALDAIARLGGDTCCTIRDRFDMPTPRFEEWRERTPTEASPPWSPTNQAAADAHLRTCGEPVRHGAHHAQCQREGPSARPLPFL